MNGKRMKISRHHLRMNLKMIRKNTSGLTLRKIHRYMKSRPRNLKNNSWRMTWMEKNTALMKNLKEYCIFSAYY